jgi:hypothetical protein
MLPSSSGLEYGVWMFTLYRLVVWQTCRGGGGMLLCGQHLDGWPLGNSTCQDFWFTWWSWKGHWQRCPLPHGANLCLGEEDAKHTLLKCSEREECVNSKWLNINEDLAYRKIIICTNVNKIRSLGKYLFKAKCKWENKVWGGGGNNSP